MAGSHDDDTAEKGHRTNRRTFMKTVGVAATAAVGSTAVTGAFAADTTVDLADEGLQNGELIDPYLEEFFVDGNEVLIPAGEYEYTGDGLGGDVANAALVGSTDGVTFNRPDDPETTVRPTIRATSGTVRIENITVRGKRGEEQSRWRVGADEGATMEVVNVNVPDGTVENSDSTGVYAGSDHAGTLLVKACYFAQLGNVACYVSDPYTGGNGTVIVEDCVFRNTNSAGVRFAPGDSVVRGCYFEATEESPTETGGGRAQRGIKIDDAGQDVVIEDCDFNWTDVGGPCIDFHERGEGGSGVVRNCRITNDGDSEPFDTEWGVSGDWTGENIQLTGSGPTDVPDGFEAVTGSEATPANTDYAIWTPVGGESASTTDDSESTTSTETETATTTETSTENSTEESTETETATPEPTETATPEPTETATPEPTATETATPEPTETATPEPTETATPEPTETATPEPTETATPEPTETATPEPTATATPEPTETATSESTETSTTDSTEGASQQRSQSSSNASDSRSDTGTEKSSTPEGYPNRIEIDGTGDAEEAATYTFSVTGDVVVDEERTKVVNSGTAADEREDTIGCRVVTGHVGNGVDAYYYSGRLRDVDVQGDGELYIYHG
ncbi:right-handed parallel beta-helix repeat-containing protein [Haloarcula pellucida]|nr:right-handed parallel beta-helix repeat-containing protein [Halomicroarcula pellucida]